jgi:alpha-tubulin suppressor-like RCC1 family protein
MIGTPKALRVVALTGVVSLMTVAGLVGIASAGPSATKPFVLSAKLARPTVVVNASVKVTGSVSPKAAGKTVKLQQLTGTRWRTIATSTLTKKSSYVLADRPTVVGRDVLRVVKPAGAGHKAGTSKRLTLTVNLPATNASSIAVGATVVGSHACAVLGAGTVECWGDNGAGDLGIGTTAPSSVPAKVNGITNAIAVAAGGDNSCALLATRRVKCWGDNTSGQDGDGTFAQRLSPVTVKGLPPALQVSVGGDFACALLVNHHVDCWGDNERATLGNGVVESSDPTPSPVAGVVNATALGLGDVGCASLQGGTVDCWGIGADLGDGTAVSSSTPVGVIGLTDAAAVAVSNSHACAPTRGGPADCWGGTLLGDLGVTSDGAATSRNFPKQVTGLTKVVSVTVGQSHSCALLINHTVDCWGSDIVGELGNGTTTNFDTANPSPVPVSSLFNAVAISAAGSTTCALLKTDAVKCWGDGTTGGLGDGNNLSSDVPVAVKGIK